MGTIKSKSRKRKIVRRNKHTKQNVQEKHIFTEDELKNIPPHLLDKIPAQMSLKPTNNTMRSMLMQRLAQPYLPMPMVPQQQQAQGLKTANDLQEQALMEAKRQLQTEKERKQELMKQDAQHKKEKTQQKHELKMEEQRLDQDFKIQQMQNDVAMLSKELEHKNTLIGLDSDIMKKRRQAEEQEALVKQSQHELNKMKREFEGDDFVKKYKQGQNQLMELEAEKQGYLQAFEELQNGTAFNEMVDIQRRTIVSQQQLIFLKELEKKQNETLRLQAQIAAAGPFNDDEENKEISALKTKLTEAQAEYAKQLAIQDEREQKMTEHEYLKKTLRDTQRKTQELELQNEELIQRNQTFDSPKKKRRIKTSITKAVESEHENKHLQETAKLTKEINDNERDQIRANATIEFLNSSKHRQNQREIAALETQKQKTEQLTEVKKQTIAAQQKYVEEKIGNEVQQAATNAKLAGKDVEEVLENELGNDNSSNIQRAIQDKKVYEQMAAQQQLQSQQEQERKEIIGYLEDLARESDENKYHIEEKLASLYAPKNWNDYFWNDSLENLQQIKQAVDEKLQYINSLKESYEQEQHEREVEADRDFWL